MKKYLTLFLCFMLAKAANADSSFLPGLGFTKLYENDSMIQSVSKNGMAEAPFINYLSSDHSLGEKATLISALASYFEWKDDATEEYFTTYKKKYQQFIEGKYKTTIEDPKVPAETRLLYCLLTDFGSSDPSKEKYKALAIELPKSLTAQSVMVIAYAYDILYNDKKQYLLLRDLEENYVKPYRTTYAQLNGDIPLAVAEDCVFDFLPYTQNCEGKLPCLCDTSNKEKLPGCLSELSKNYLNKIENKESLPQMTTRSDWDELKPLAMEWIKAEEVVIDGLKLTAFEKEALRFLLISQTYNLLCSYNALASYSAYSFNDKIKENAVACKNQADCILTKIEQEQKIAIQKAGTKADELAKSKEQQMRFSQSLSKSTGEDAAASAVSSTGDVAIYFEDDVLQLRTILYYYMLHADKIMEIY
jgi:hypothetical protein